MPHVIKFDNVSDIENNTFSNPRISMIITELRGWLCIACTSHKHDFGQNKVPSPFLNTAIRHIGNRMQ